MNSMAKTSRASTPEPSSAALANAYRPITRGYFLAAAFYYILIAVSHPLYEHGPALLVFEALAIGAALAGFFFWRSFGKNATTKRWRLTVSDDGPCVETTSASGKSSLGMTIVDALVTQLGGKLITWRDDGLHIQIQVPEPARS